MKIIIIDMNFTNIILKYINNSHPIVKLETIARILTIAFSIIMTLNIQNRTGLMIYNILL